LAILPLLALGVLSYALDALDISDPRLQGQFDALFDGLRLVALANALSRALFAPGAEKWRLLAVSDDTAGVISRLWVGIAAIVSVEKWLEPAADAVSSLNLVILLRALTAALIAVLVAWAVWRNWRHRNAKAQSDLASYLRFAGGAGAAGLLSCALFGLVALATFAISQTLFIAGLAATLYLFDASVQAAGDRFVARESSGGRPVSAQAGALAQGIVLAQGFLRLTVCLIAVVLVLAPWGFRSQDMLGSLREAYLGISIGGTVVSFETILGALFVFVLGVFLSRTLQNWLGAKLLPQTRLDAGLRNSIRTVTGYVGFVIALALAGGQLGLDFQKVAIVAGALSVGIGFGLQGIVNNFLSGLILLAERAIRVGDWVVVGNDQGFVRRISARATEIETIDRGTLIVPNSNLVNNPVKNWMYADRVARIIVAVNIAYETDPEQAQAILIAAAKAQDLVMTIPAPLVLFHEFGDWTLKFQLVCYVDDVMLAERVRSELNFDVLRRFKEAGLKIPYPK
jgi:small-conductance mechanosensitive channel